MTEASIHFPPGVTTLLSRAAKIKNWQDCNLMRWEDGTTLRPVGGWEEIPFAIPFASRVRAMHKWVDRAAIVRTAYVCEQHVYMEAGGTLTDITPDDGIAPVTGTVSGYGEQKYGESTYGTPRSGLSTLERFSAAWSVNNWGEDLLVMISYDGRLLRWQPSVIDSKLIAVPGAPVGNRQFVVTPNRHCMVFQLAGEIADFGWCSQEDIEDWDFANPFNTAGMFTAYPYSPIIAAHSSAVGITVHTPAMTHLVEYLGLPYIYRTRQIGKIPIPISAASVSSIPEGIIWISAEGFWLYNGSTGDIIPCPVWDVISSKMDFQRTVRESHSVNMLVRGEVWWFWVDPEYGLECTRYIAIDYRSKIWMGGFLNRTCGNSYGNDRFPLMSDGYKVWKHETGLVYPEALFMPYIESQTINIANGSNWATLHRLLPDVAGNKTALTFRVARNNDRTDYASQTYSPQRVINEHGWVDIRETARDIRLRIDMVHNEDWSTIGPIIFDIRPRGKKK